MKVLHVNEHLARKGGVETYMLSLLPMLPDYGVSPTFVYAKGDASIFTPSISVPGIHKTGFKNDAPSQKHMESVLSQEKPDVIHIHNMQNLGVLRACLSYGSTVMTAHDYRTVCPASTFFYKRTREECKRTCGPGCFTTTLTKHCLTPRLNYASYYYKRARWITKHANRFSHVIAPSHGAQKRLLEAGFNQDKMSVLPYFCPLEPTSKPRPVPEKITMTFIGRIAPNKGHEYFVEALGQLPENVHGVMVGSFTPPNEALIDELAQKFGCKHRLSLRKWATRPEVIEILDQTTVFIFPSLWPETLGIVGIEALSRGVPVVASDIGGVREWLEDGVNGHLVQPKQPGQIRDAVLKIIEKKDTLIAYGENGIKTVRERFLPTQHTSQLVQLYERIACAH